LATRVLAAALSRHGSLLGIVAGAVYRRRGYDEVRPAHDLTGCLLDDDLHLLDHRRSS
jgi:hypothetical protein